MEVARIETAEMRQAQLQLYKKLAEAEEEIAANAAGTDFFAFAKKLRSAVHGTA